MVGNKCDLATEEQIESFRSYVEGKGLTFVPFSAATMQGVPGRLPGLVYNRLKDIPPVPVFTIGYRSVSQGQRPCCPLQRMKPMWNIGAPWLLRQEAAMVDDYESLQYFQRPAGRERHPDRTGGKGACRRTTPSH